MWITDMHLAWVVVSSSWFPRAHALLSASPAVQCLTQLKWPEPTFVSLQEVKQPFKLACVITAGPDFVYFFLLASHMAAVI